VAREKLGVETAELNAYLTEQAYRLGLTPDRLARQLTDNGQLNAVVADVLRSKALGLIARRAKVTDETGRPVDVNQVPDAGADAEAAAEQADQPEPDAADE
jgi:trigger factor